MFINCSEYYRQSKRDAKKEENVKLEKAELVHRLAELSFRVEHQDAQLREMARAFSDLGRYIFQHLFYSYRLFILISITCEGDSNKDNKQRKENKHSYEKKEEEDYFFQDDLLEDDVNFTKTGN